MADSRGRRTAAMSSGSPDGQPMDLEPLVQHFRSPDYRFAIASGWWPIVRRCHEEVVAAFPDYELLAVKQKFGVLAFQAFPRPWRPGGNWTTDEDVLLDEIIEKYVDESSVTCEYCGAPGDLRTARPVQRTLCDACDAWDAQASAEGG